MLDALHNRKSRGRLTGGIILLLIGGISLAINLGLEIPRDWWKFWPWLLVVLGALQISWPGKFGARWSGYWLLVVGAYGMFVSYEWLGLNWLSAWPIFVIATGVRVVLTGIFRNND